MQTVQQLLERKGWGVFSVAPRATVQEAMALLAERNVGAVLVLERERIVGIFSERDCVRRVLLKQLPSLTTPVSQVMTSPVKCVKVHDTVERCMRTMSELRVRHLPVLEGERAVGMISVGDLVKAQLSEQESLIHDLESYIAGSPASVRPPAA